MPRHSIAEFADVVVCIAVPQNNFSILVLLPKFLQPCVPLSILFEKDQSIEWGLNRERYLR